jgi:hypothetical protein
MHTCAGSSVPAGTLSSNRDNGMHPCTCRKDLTPCHASAVTDLTLEILPGCLEDLSGWRSAALILSLSANAMSSAWDANTPSSAACAASMRAASTRDEESGYKRLNLRAQQYSA